jgi:predicted acetyltransferase
MGMKFRWVGEEEYPRVAETRMRCYGDPGKDRERFIQYLRNDPRGKPGDYLLAEMDGRAVGTATSFSFNMWVRGASMKCQGVAWVGAIKTMRRRAERPSSGVASGVMWEMVKKAREKGDVVSALMPFRASYYEHFGYGLVEWRNEWTVPMGILPSGEFDGIRFYEAEDFAARMECLRRVNQGGQCAVERSEEYWRAPVLEAEEKTQIVDRPEEGGAVRGSMFLATQQIDGKFLLKVTEAVYEDLVALRRQLHFLSSLKDQYYAVQIQLPRDVPLSEMLREPQVFQKAGNHATAEVRSFTRMMVRVLDHKAFLEAVRWPGEIRGSVTVSVQESEGHKSRFRVQVEGGRASVKASDATADLECTDQQWAAIACGQKKASEAVRWGLAVGREGAGVLDGLAAGPAVFCQEQF